MIAAISETPAIWKGKKIMLKPGQFTCGLKQLSDWTGVEKTKIRRIISVFKSDAQIDYLTSNKFSLYTVLNWDKYQAVPHKMPRKCLADDSEVTPLEEGKKERSIVNPTDLLSEPSASQLLPTPDEPVQFRNQHPTAATKKKRKIKYRIGWDDVAKEFTGVEQSDVDEWRKILPATISLQRVMDDIADWYYHNPNRRKKDIKRFVNRWLYREAEKVETLTMRR